MSLHITYHSFLGYIGEVEAKIHLEKLFVELKNHIQGLEKNNEISLSFHRGQARGVVLACGAAEVYAPAGYIADLLECANELVRGCAISNLNFKGFDSFLFDGMPDEEINDAIKHLRELAKQQGMKKFKLGHVEDALFVNARQRKARDG